MNAIYSILPCLAGKPFHMNRTKLFSESNCFRFYPYEQALNVIPSQKVKLLDVTLEHADVSAVVQESSFVHISLHI